MQYIPLAAVVWVLMAGVAGAQPSETQLMAPIQKFVDSFNKGDIAGAAATHAPAADLTIIDEVPPYLWRGPKAFQAWSADLENDAKKNGLTDLLVTIRAATRVETNGDQAYVIVPATFTFKRQAVAMRGTAQMAVVLKKGASGWLIHGWTWTGERPQKVASQ